MKQFIVLLAVLPLMFVFLLQFTLDEQTEAKRAVIDSLVYTSKEKARQDGYFSPENIDALVNNICSSCNIKKENVAVIADSVKKPRICKSSSNWSEDLIHYEVRVTLGAIMAGGSFLGIKDEDNILCYVINSYTASENVD